MTNDDETVFIVDDEEPVRRSFKYLLESVKLRVEAFESAEALLKKLTPTAHGCIVLDVRMPGISGPELMDHLTGIGLTIPIIFLSAHGDVPLAVRAMRGGAIDFLQKPPNSQVFLECVRRALASDRQARQERAEIAVVNERLNGSAKFWSAWSPGRATRPSHANSTCVTRPSRRIAGA